MAGSEDAPVEDLFTAYDPCDPCYRNMHLPGVATVKLADKRLLAAAVEGAGDTDAADKLLTGQEWGQVFGVDRNVTFPVFAASVCGRAIQRGACASWEFDPESNTIVPRVAIAE